MTWHKKTHKKHDPKKCNRVVRELAYAQKQQPKKKVWPTTSPCTQASLIHCTDLKYLAENFYPNLQGSQRLWQIACRSQTFLVIEGLREYRSKTPFKLKGPWPHYSRTDRALRSRKSYLRLVNLWNSLPKSVVDAENTNQFKARYDKLC